MKSEELLVIVRYAYHLSRLVSPKDAKNVGLTQFDDKVCALLKYFATHLSNDNISSFSVEKDDFYREVFDKMSSDISNMYGD